MPLSSYSSRDILILAFKAKNIPLYDIRGPRAYSTRLNVCEVTSIAIQVIVRQGLNNWGFVGRNPAVAVALVGKVIESKELVVFRPRILVEVENRVPLDLDLHVPVATALIKSQPAIDWHPVLLEIANANSPLPIPYAELSNIKAASP